jgi:chromosome segregation protein
MYLSKLEIFGFKSFAQKTTLKFTDGIACVIGPNGSGKSNIVDAIRWVLGEQKTTQLRTDRMENLIFNGTHARKPLGMAEVSLTVNNNKRILKTEFTDVVVSRRLYRSGESHYLINKDPSRLKDIIDLFMDTGMGANSYSVIELSMVESIISENPAERRHLFEEAAGVTKYKTRRKSALRKLELTQQDMSRITDLIAEIQRNVNSLSRQVGKARRYLTYQEELKTKEIELAKFRYTHYMDELRPLQKQLEEISLIKEDTSHQITLEEALLEDYRREIMQIESEIEKSNKKIQMQDENLHQIKEQEAVAATRIHAIMESINRNSRDVDEFNLKIDESKKWVVEEENKKRTLESQISVHRDKFAEKQEDKKESETKLETSHSARDELREQLQKFSNELSKFKESRQQKYYYIESKNETVSALEVQRSGSETAHQTISGHLAEIISKKKSCSEKINQLSKNLDSAVSAFNTTQEKQQKLIIQGEQVQAQLESARSRKNFFKQVIEKYEGHNRGTQHIMAHRQDFQGVHGPLADLINVTTEYRIAVETVLGDALNYIVIDTFETALQMLNRLRPENIGRFTLLSLDIVSKIDHPNIEIPDNLSPLSNHISFDKQYNKLINILLGDVVIVDHLSEGISALKKNRSFRFITQAGEFLDSNAGISLGEKQDSDASLIGRATRLAEIDELIESLSQELDSIRNEQKNCQRSLEQHETQITELTSEKSVLEAQYSEHDRAETEHSVELKTAAVTSKERCSEIDQVQKDISIAEKELHSIDRDIQKFSTEYQEIEKKFQDAEKEYLELEKSHLLQLDSLQNVQIQNIQEENELNTITSSIRRNQQNIAELRELIGKREQETLELNEELARIEKQKIEFRATKEKVWDERDKSESDKGRIQQNYHDLKDKILNLENQIKKYRKQHDTSLERSKQLELHIHDINMKAENLFEHMKEEYGQDIAVGIGFDGLDVENHQQRIESLKFRIKQLGQVNPLAVSEYEKESERLEFYTKQYNDLDEAIKSLQKTITKINMTARKQFLEVFNQIKENFEKVFGSFFENGEGSLNLEEHADPLESNIDIMVRPKGKRVTTINLLSGGEKTLTAISLLFSIYLVKPSPFCILDEIDAPLDDVNIGRFTSALKDFSKETQFIVVTHNKRTMESADTMYGVTMEEEGLSKLVSVKFN